MNITESSIICRNPDIISSEIDNETVMMDESFQNYFGLEAVASEIWRLVEKPISIAQLCEQLTAKYNVDVEQCIKDISPFLSDLSKNNMITIG